VWIRADRFSKDVPGRRDIVIHEPPKSEAEHCKDPIAVVDRRQLALLDPTGARARLFDKTNMDRARVGDILLVTFKTGDPVSGVIMSIKGSGPHTSVLLRNQLTTIGMEMAVKVHSPNVQSMEVAQRTPKRKRRARLYYLRKPEHDVGSVQKVVDQYLRQRALLTGGKSSSRQGSGMRSKRGKR
jgi:ribosomal protein L19